MIMTGYSTKAELCRDIERRVGKKYGKKLWTYCNADLEHILIKEMANDKEKKL